MNDWGINSNVALFIGGPEDGVIKDIGKTRQIRVAEVEPMHLYTFASRTPVRTVNNYRYVNYERCQVVSVSGQVYTVMADRQQNDLRDISDRVMEEVMYGSRPMRYAPGGGVSSQHTHWAYGQDYTVTYQQLQDWFDMYAPPKKKSPEEALAWLHEKKGKDFL